MQCVTLLCVGKVKTSWISEGCDHYVGRLKPAMKFEVCEIPASKEKDAAKQQADESQRLLSVMQESDADVWVLDEKGKTMTSAVFASFIASAKDQGKPLLFVLGGAYGLNDAMKRAARGSIRLSDMTFPHELCRLVFLEQLYRAAEIGKGSGYHH